MKDDALPLPPTTYAELMEGFDIVPWNMARDFSTRK
jgi:hypothetical protein